MENPSSLRIEPPHQVMPLWQEKDLRSFGLHPLWQRPAGNFSTEKCCSRTTSNWKFQTWLCGWAQPTSTAPLQEVAFCKKAPPCKSLIFNSSWWQQEALWSVKLHTSSPSSTTDKYLLFYSLLEMQERTVQCTQTTPDSRTDYSCAYKQVFLKKRHLKCNRF